MPIPREFLDPPVNGGVRIELSPVADVTSLDGVSSEPLDWLTASRYQRAFSTRRQARNFARFRRDQARPEGAEPAGNVLDVSTESLLDRPIAEVEREGRERLTFAMQAPIRAIQRIVDEQGDEFELDGEEELDEAVLAVEREADRVAAHERIAEERFRTFERMHRALAAGGVRAGPELAAEVLGLPVQPDMTAGPAPPPDPAATATIESIAAEVTAVGDGEPHGLDLPQLAQDIVLGQPTPEAARAVADGIPMLSLQEARARAVAAGHPIAVRLTPEAVLEHQAEIALQRMKIEMQRAAEEREREEARKRGVAICGACAAPEDSPRHEPCRVRAKAKARARELLLSHLSRRQREEFAKTQAFRVRGSSGGRYRLKLGRTSNVERLEDGTDKVLKVYCCHPDDDVPDEDTLIAQKMTIECDEEHFLAKANTRAPYNGESAWPADLFTRPVEPIPPVQIVRLSDRRLILQRSDGLLQPVSEEVYLRVVYGHEPAIISEHGRLVVSTDWAQDHPDPPVTPRRRAVAQEAAA